MNKTIAILKSMLYDTHALPCGWVREENIRRNNALIKGIEAVEGQLPADKQMDEIRHMAKSLTESLTESRNALTNGGKKPRMYYQAIDDTLSPFESLLDGIRALEVEEKES